MHICDQKKSGRSRDLRCISVAYGALDGENLILDAEFLALQIRDSVLVGKGTPVLLIDGALELSMLRSQRLDAILQRHALFLLLDDDAPDGNAGHGKRPDRFQ